MLPIWLVSASSSRHRRHSGSARRDTLLSAASERPEHLQVGTLQQIAARLPVLGRRGCQASADFAVAFGNIGQQDAGNAGIGWRSLCRKYACRVVVSLTVETSDRD